MNEEEFKKAFDDVFNDLLNFNFVDKESLVCAVNVLMFLANKSIIDNTVEEIYEHALKNIDFLKISNKLDMRFDEKFYTSMLKNFVDYSEDIDMFNDFFSKIRIEAESTKGKSLKVEAKLLLSTMMSSMDDVYDRLIINIRGNSDLYNIPILKYIDSSDFSEQFWEMSHTEKSHLGRTLNKRYEDVETNKLLLSELPWLKKVYHNISAANAISSKRMTKYLVNTYFLPNIAQALEKLNNSREGQ